MVSEPKTFKAGDKVYSLYGAKGEVWGEVISHNNGQLRIKATHTSEYLGGRRKRVTFETNVLVDYTKLV